MIDSLNNVVIYKFDIKGTSKMGQDVSLKNLESFIAGIGKVLARVKDVMVQDILKDIVSDGMTWDEYKQKFDGNTIEKIDEIKLFIDKIINKLGYDISSAKTSELYDLFKSLVITAKDLEETVVALVDDGKNIDWSQLSKQSGSIEGVFDGLKSTYNSIPSDSLDRLFKLIDLVKDVISLVKKISSFEWNKIANDADGFGQFLKNTYFTEQFGKRILDYILILLLKNAKEVFYDDVHNLISSVSEEFKTNINSIFKDAEAYDDLLYYQGEIDKANTAIEKYLESARECALNNNIFPDFTIPVILQARLDNAQSRFNKIAEDSVNGFSKVAKVFKQIYAILDFLGLIEIKKITLQKFIPKSAEALNLQPIEVLSFKWNLFTKIFTDPLGYLKTVFCISSIEDVEYIIGKLTAVVRAFNDDNLDFYSPKRLLFSIAFKIKSCLVDKYRNEANKETLEKFGAFIIELLSTQNAIGDKFKGIAKNEFSKYRKGEENLFTILEENVIDAFSKINFNEEGIYRDENDIMFVSFFSKKQDAIDRIICETVIPVFQKSIVNTLYDEFEEDENSIKSILEQSIQGLIPSIRKGLKEQSEQISLFVTGCWKDYFYVVFEELYERLVFDMRDFHNYNEDGITDTERKCIIDNKIANFSYFDFDEYFLNISEKFAHVVPFQFYYYKNDIRESLEVIIKKVLNSLSKKIDNEQVDKLVGTIVGSAWEECESACFDIVAKPYCQTINVAVGNLKKQIIQQISDDCFSDEEPITVSDDIVSLFTQDSIDKVYKLLKVVSDSHNISSWCDGLKFIVELLRLIPDSVKNSLKGIINIPDFDISLPKYSLDTKNKMLAVELCNYKNDNFEFMFQLVACVNKRKINGVDKNGLYLIPIVKIVANGNFQLGENHELIACAGVGANEGVNGGFDGKTGFFFYTNDKIYDISVEAFSDRDSVSLNAEITFQRKNGHTLEVFDTKVASLKIENYPLNLYLGYNRNVGGVIVPGFDFGVSGAIKVLCLTLKLKELNEFFNTILKKNIEITLEELAVGYSLSGGFNIGGSFFVSIPLFSEIEYNGIKFSNISVEIGGRDGDLIARVSTSFSATISGFSISFSDLGMGCSCNILDEKGKLGDFDLSPNFKYPSGLAIAIDTQCVKGAGAVEWNKDEGWFFGAGSLEVMEKFGVSAFFLFTTSPFSFMGALNVEWKPGLPMGMGFTLTGLGGSLGINRSLDIDKLRAAVYDGSLSSILFVKNLEQNLDKVLANISAFYPESKDTCFFGFLAKIEWNEIIKINAGLFIQVLPFKAVVAGDIQIRVAEKMENLICINVNFIGGIDLSKGLFFDASIYDSKIVGIDLQGDMAIRIYWAGSTKGFILSVGGFHPEYKPEEGFNLPDLRRMQLSLDYSIVKMKLEAYFAVTSNTVQFGAELNMQINLAVCKITGYLVFNALFQFKPFMFKVGVKAGVAVKVGSVKLMSVDLAFELSGPAQWRAKGEASFRIIFKIKAHFNVSWGKKQESINREKQDLLPLFSKEFDDNRNWKAISSDKDENLVLLASKSAGDLVIQPSDTIRFSQDVLPLDEKMECYGEKQIGDYDNFEIDSIFVGDQPLSSSDSVNISYGGQEGCTYKMEQSSFAPGLIHKLDNDQKLKEASFVSKNSGFSLDAGFGLKNGDDVKEVPDEKRLIMDDIDIDSEAWKEVQSYLNDDKTETVSNNDNSKRCRSRSSYRRSRSGFKCLIKELDEQMISAITDNLAKQK